MASPISFYFFPIPSGTIKSGFMTDYNNKGAHIVMTRRNSGYISCGGR